MLFLIFLKPCFLDALNRDFMLRILLFLFTLNAFLSPISGYAALTVSESVAPEMTSQASANMPMMNGMKCAMPNPCINCDMSDMDAGCSTNCDIHCLSSVMNISNPFNLDSNPAISAEIITAFKHFYTHSSSPELRPPLI